MVIFSSRGATCKPEHGKRGKAEQTHPRTYTGGHHFGHLLPLHLNGIRGHPIRLFSTQSFLSTAPCLLGSRASHPFCSPTVLRTTEPGDLYEAGCKFDFFPLLPTMHEERAQRFGQNALTQEYPIIIQVGEIIVWLNPNLGPYKFRSLRSGVSLGFNDKGQSPTLIHRGRAQGLQSQPDSDCMQIPFKEHCHIQHPVGPIIGMGMA